MTNKKTTKTRQKKKIRLIGRYFRLVIPNLVQGTKNLPKLKQKVYDLLQEKETSRGLEKWSISVETHKTTGVPHLDILLIYSGKIFNSYSRYDYIIKHGNLTRYSRLNEAILAYNFKEDKSPIRNFDISKSLVKYHASNKKGLYKILETAMLENPFTFNANEWIHDKKIRGEIIMTSWQSIVKAIQIEQEIVCNKLLRSKPGIQLITSQLIRSKLSPEELKIYNSWSGYQVIVDHINQIPTYGTRRPHKMKQLLIIGPPNTGKTTLALEIEKYVAVYYKDVTNWFPKYRSHVYGMILWNEFGLKSMKYQKLLNLLEGVKLDLEYKGGSTLKIDSQLMFMTSNIPLNRHIQLKFRDSKDRRYSRLNLRARITEVILPSNHNLFFLTKLINRSLF